MSKFAPYSLQHVHCAHCEPCKNRIECLKDEALRRKCPSTTRRDDLKKHTSTHHERKTPKAIGDEKQLKIRGFFATVSPSPPPLPTS